METFLTIMIIYGFIYIAGELYRIDESSVMDKHEKHTKSEKDYIERTNWIESGK